MQPRIDRTATVAQIVAEHPVTTAVFRKCEIDYCCRGDATVHEACRERRLDPEKVFAHIEDVISGAPGRAQDGGAPEAPGASLVAHIVEHHHAYERRALPYILSLLPKVAGCHRKRNAQLDELCDAGQDLADTLEAYIEEEERRLFPALLSGGCEVVRGEMNRHNREVSLLLAQVRSLAGGYVAPEWGDHSYRALMEELEALEKDVKERIHFANHVLARS